MWSSLEMAIFKSKIPRFKIGITFLCGRFFLVKELELIQFIKMILGISKFDPIPWEFSFEFLMHVNSLFEDIHLPKRPRKS